MVVMGYSLIEIFFILKKDYQLKKKVNVQQILCVFLVKFMKKRLHKNLKNKLFN